MSWFRRAQNPEEAIDHEIAFHIEELSRRYLEQGLTPEEAHRRAMLEFGGREQTKQQMREVHVSRLGEAFLFNLKAAVRFLRKSPSFSIAVILTLALAIGANSAVFSAIDAILLRPLPYPAGDQLVALDEHNTQGGDANHFVAPVRLEDWNRLNSTLRAVSGYYFDDISETSGSLPEKITEAMVAPRFLQVMGIAPALGRDFTAGEMHFGGPKAVLISYRYWQQHFHGDSTVLGERLHIEGNSYPIVGVMPASFQFPDDDVDVWAPSPTDAPFE